MTDGETAAYLDSSALLKLIAIEHESAALRAAVSRWPSPVSSELAHIEVVRAARRYGSTVARRAEEVVQAIALRPIDRDIVHRAARLEPATLRSLDAIHLATALALEPPVGAFFSYDTRLNGAAEAAGLHIEAPA